MAEKPKGKRVNLLLEDEAYALIVSHAKKNKISLSAAANELIADGIRRMEAAGEWPLPPKTNAESSAGGHG